MGKSRRSCLVANRATLPQKWPPIPRNVADSCELTATTQQTEPSMSRGRTVNAEGCNARDASARRAPAPETGGEEGVPGASASTDHLK